MLIFSARFREFYFSWNLQPKTLIKRYKYFETLWSRVTESSVVLKGWVWLNRCALLVCTIDIFLVFVNNIIGSLAIVCACLTSPRLQTKYFRLFDSCTWVPSWRDRACHRTTTQASCSQNTLARFNYRINNHYSHIFQLCCDCIA